MSMRSLSFDDDSADSLWVHSISDLSIGYWEARDLDWEEVVERTALDERRGLVIAQTLVLEDLVNDAIIYLARRLILIRINGTWRAQPLGPA